MPVRLAGNDRLFLLDTGCGKTVVERTLLKGRPLQQVTMHTPGGPTVLPEYFTPDASVGVLGFRGVESVIGADLAPFAVACGRPVAGCLGMDFLGRYRIAVDFDGGEVLFLQAAGPVPGRRVPLAWRWGGTPRVTANVPGAGKVDFILDTGWMGANSGDLDRATFGRLLRGSGFNLGRRPRRCRPPAAIPRGWAGRPRHIGRVPDPGAGFLRGRTSVPGPGLPVPLRGHLRLPQRRHVPAAGHADGEARPLEGGARAGNRFPNRGGMAVRAFVARPLSAAPATAVSLGR